MTASRAAADILWITPEIRIVWNDEVPDAAEISLNQVSDCASTITLAVGSARAHTIDWGEKAHF